MTQKPAPVGIRFLLAFRYMRIDFATLLWYNII